MPNIAEAGRDILCDDRGDANRGRRRRLCECLPCKKKKRDGAETKISEIAQIASTNY
jgi:hypothetical protein